MTIFRFFVFLVSLVKCCKPPGPTVTEAWSNGQQEQLLCSQYFLPQGFVPGPQRLHFVILYQCHCQCLEYFSTAGLDYICNTLMSVPLQTMMQYFAKTIPVQVFNTPKPSLCQFWLCYHCNFAAPFCFFAQLCQLVTNVNNSNSVKAKARSKEEEV